MYETIFEQRFKHLDELRRMGAHIKLMDRTVLIEGVPTLYGAPVTITDLRAGAALVIAGLMAKGTTEVYETAFIDRGYERLEQKLRSLGADIARERIWPVLRSQPAHCAILTEYCLECSAKGNDDERPC